MMHGSEFFWCIQTNPQSVTYCTALSRYFLIKDKREENVFIVFISCVFNSDRVTEPKCETFPRGLAGRCCILHNLLPIKLLIGISHNMAGVVPLSTVGQEGQN